MSDVIIAIPERTKEELEIEQQWIAAVLSHAVKSPSDHKTRLNGTYAYAVLYYYLTGTLEFPSYGPYISDMEPVFNVYATAPPHVQPHLLPILNFLKRKAYGEDDKIPANAVAET